MHEMLLLRTTVTLLKRIIFFRKTIVFFWSEGSIR